MVLYAESENSHWVKMSRVPLWRPPAMSRVPAPSLGQNQGLVSATEGSGGNDEGVGHRAHR